MLKELTLENMTLKRIKHGVQKTKPFYLKRLKQKNMRFNHQDPKQFIGSKQNKHFDTGEVLKKNRMNNLKDHQKYMICKNHIVLDSSYSFRKFFEHECNCSGTILQRRNRNGK